MGGGHVKSKIIPEILAVICLVNSAVCRAGAAVDGLFSCFFLFLVPLACSTATACRLKGRGRIYTAILAVLEGMLLLLCRNITAAAGLWYRLTGHYNLEAAGFSLLFTVLFNTGLLTGAGLGRLIWSRRDGSK